jgi:hypothetical protein
MMKYTDITPATADMTDVACTVAGALHLVAGS